MAETAFRPAGAADLPTVAAIARAAYAPYVPRMGREPAPMAADFAAHLARGELSVLEDGDGAVVGFIVMFAKADSWFVENVAVDPARHGAGLGRALMARAEAAARAAGHGRVALYTNIHMTENLAFYPRLGFTETHRVTEDGFDRVYLAKALPAPGGG